MSELKNVLQKFFNYMGNNKTWVTFEEIEKTAQKASIEEVGEVLSRLLLITTVDPIKKSYPQCENWLVEVFAPVEELPVTFKELIGILHTVLLAKWNNEHFFKENEKHE